MRWHGFFLLLFCLKVVGHEADSTINRLGGYVYEMNEFFKYIPQEKVYVHLDNTAYYQGDGIWFKCYVVTAGLYTPSQLSKTLYVELLNPGGTVVAKRVLKIENGQCHGDFILDQLPFYSGFYEIRAYTKYMLNFGDEAIFSRLLPVFDKPKEEGNFAQKDMQRYGIGRYPMKRVKPKKGKKVNVKFFPEGGNLVEGLSSRVAFEATDAYGNPIKITGAIIDKSGEEITRFSVLHEGKGTFIYTPASVSSSNKIKAVVEYKGKTFDFDLPTPLLEGVVLKVDNSSCTDSVEITLQKNNRTPAGVLGLAVISSGKPSFFCIVDLSDNEPMSFKINKTQWLTGVSRLVVFDQAGEILCDRLVFTCKDELLNIQAKTNKEVYNPYELVNMEFTVSGDSAQSVETGFSLSVRESTNGIASGHTVLTDLLLMSEIKGYVRNPSYYFEAADSVHQTALDLLLMVQGWRRYSWKQTTGIEPFNLKYMPEQGIETNGQVVSFVRKKPKPEVEVSSFLLKRGEEKKEKGSFLDIFVTDSLGRFSFVSDLYGKWNMILAVTEKGKKKDYRILLDRLFSPPPRQYKYADMQINPPSMKEEENEEDVKEPGDFEEDMDVFLSAYEDSLAKIGNRERIYHLKEVKVTAKKTSKEKDIFDNRSTSIAYYDVRSELDDIKDSGKYIGDDINELLVNMNENFYYIASMDCVIYKNKAPLFVINYKPTTCTELDANWYKQIRLEAIKSIYINEKLSAICRYADPRLSPMDVDDLYSCAVFIETYPDGLIPAEAGKGVRKTWLEGYYQPAEFYHPDYSVLPPTPDYRRTLYWNPSVQCDKEGKARISFYNNSRCRKFEVSAETVTSGGKIGVCKD